jgi:dihydrofolate reductase
MRKLAVVEYMSLDGVVQAPGHAGEDPEGGFVHGGWTGPFMGDHRRHNDQLFPTAGAFLFGRRTYEIFAEYWSTVPGAGRHHEVAESGPLMFAGTPAVAGGVAVLTGQLARRSMRVAHDTRSDLT